MFNLSFVFSQVSIHYDSYELMWLRLNVNVGVQLM